MSRAKDLGFTPASETASKLIVEMTLSNVRNADGSIPTQNDMTLPRGAIFQTVFDGQPYNFVVPTSIKPTSEGTRFVYSNVELVKEHMQPIHSYMTDKSKTLSLFYQMKELINNTL